MTMPTPHDSRNHHVRHTGGRIVNSTLAETWEQKGDRIEQDVFADRTHEYHAEAPAGVLVITAGVPFGKPGNTNMVRIAMVESHTDPDQLSLPA